MSESWVGDEAFSDVPTFSEDAAPFEPSLEPEEKDLWTRYGEAHFDAMQAQVEGWKLIGEVFGAARRTTPFSELHPKHQSLRYWFGEAANHESVRGLFDAPVSDRAAAMEQIPEEDRQYYGWCVSEADFNAQRDHLIEEDRDRELLEQHPWLEFGSHLFLAAVGLSVSLPFAVRAQLARLASYGIMGSAAAGGATGFGTSAMNASWRLGNQDRYTAEEALSDTLGGTLVGALFGTGAGIAREVYYRLAANINTKIVTDFAPSVFEIPYDGDLSRTVEKVITQDGKRVGINDLVPASLREANQLAVMGETARRCIRFTPVANCVAHNSTIMNMFGHGMFTNNYFTKADVEGNAGVVAAEGLINLAVARSQESGMRMLEIKGKYLAENPHVTVDEFDQDCVRQIWTHCQAPGSESAKAIALLHKEGSDRAVARAKKVGYVDEEFGDVLADSGIGWFPVKFDKEKMKEDPHGAIAAIRQISGEFTQVNQGKIDRAVSSLDKSIAERDAAHDVLSKAKASAAKQETLLENEITIKQSAIDSAIERNKVIRERIQEFGGTLFNVSDVSHHDMASQLGHPIKIATNESPELMRLNDDYIKAVNKVTEAEEGLHLARTTEIPFTPEEADRAAMRIYSTIVGDVPREGNIGGSRGLTTHERKLVTNLERWEVMKSYLRHDVPVIQEEITRNVYTEIEAKAAVNGIVDMVNMPEPEKEALKGMSLETQMDTLLVNEYSPLIAGAETAKQADKYRKEMNIAREKIPIYLEAFRGVHGRPRTSSGRAARAAMHAIRAFNNLTRLGSVIFSALEDLTNFILPIGFTDAASSMWRSFKGHSVRANSRQMRIVGQAAEKFREQFKAELGRYGPPQLTLDRMSDHGWRLGCVAIYDDHFKAVAATTYYRSLLEALHAPKPTKEQQVTIASANLTDAYKMELMPLLEKHVTYDEYRFPVLDFESMGDSEAVNAFIVAGVSHARFMVTTPGLGSRPPWFNSNWGLALMQYRDFNLAYMNDVLFPTYLNGQNRKNLTPFLACSIGMGLAGAYIAYKTDGKDPDLADAGFIWDVIKKSSLLGMGPEVIDAILALVTTKGDRDFGRAVKRVSPVLSTTADALGIFANLVEVATDRDKRLTESETERVRRNIPYASHPFIKQGSKWLRHWEAEHNDRVLMRERQ